MNLSTKIKLLFATALGYFSLGQTATADFFEAVQTPTKGQVQLISTQSNANRFIDKDGNNKNIDIGRIVNNLTLKFKNNGIFAGVTIPYISAKNNLIADSISVLQLV